MNVLLPLLPVDGGELTLVSGGLIEEIENGLDLSKLVSAFHSARGHSQSVQPFVSQIIV